MNQEISFVFEYENEELVQLPITPSDFQVKYAGNNKTTNIISLGEVNLLKSRKLATFSIEAWLPDEDWYPDIRTSGRFKPSQFYVDFFERVRDSKKPCRLMIYGLDFIMNVSIESFTTTRKGGEHEDLYFVLEMKEYRPFGVTELPKETTEVLDKKTPTLQPTELTIGTTVIVNGVLHSDSYGGGAGKTLVNYTGAVNLINKKGTHPYHIVNTSGGWLGWVDKDSLSISPNQITGIPLNNRPKKSSTTKKNEVKENPTIEDISNSTGETKKQNTTNYLRNSRDLIRKGIITDANLHG